MSCKFLILPGAIGPGKTKSLPPRGDFGGFIATRLWVALSEASFATSVESPC